jgi:hypothetical protein
LYVYLPDCLSDRVLREDTQKENVCERERKRERERERAEAKAGREVKGKVP